MEIRLHNAARNDLRDGYEFYDRQSAGLGDDFLQSLENDINGLELSRLG